MPSKPSVLVTRAIFPDLLAELKAKFRVEANQSDRPWSPAELQRRLKGKDGAIILLTDRVDERLLARCPGLKIVSNIAVGYNNIDVEACTRAGVMATNTPGVLDQTTADFTWALLLAASRRLVEADAHMRTGKWGGWGLMQFLGGDVHGKTLGIVGLGRIGRAVAKRAKGFEMRVLYHNPKRADAGMERDLGVSYADLKTLLRESDFVSLHVPLLPETTHLLGAQELSWMKPDAILINTARGPVVDEKALVRALRTKALGGAALDVYEREPACEKALLKMPNVVVAPHVASASVETRRRMARTAVDNLSAGLSGKRPPNLLNYQAFAKTAD